MLTPIDRFYPELWEPSQRELLESLSFYHEPFADAINVKRLPIQRFECVPLAIQEPIEPLHPNPPAIQHQFLDEAQHLVDCDEPIQFFYAILQQYEFRTILNETKRYRKKPYLDSQPHKFPVPNYEQIRCSVGLLL